MTFMNVAKARNIKSVVQQWAVPILFSRHSSLFRKTPDNEINLTEVFKIVQNFICEIIIPDNNKRFYQ